MKAKSIWIVSIVLLTALPASGCLAIKSVSRIVDLGEK